ncbi:MAG: SWIM zinc finger family protein [Campylobacterota bacterium]|nr:SWIM zinc finger family protein [Campylobacterota bacterium]
MENEYFLGTVYGANSLSKSIENLDMEDIEAMAEHRIYQRGLDYYRGDSVEIVEQTDERVVAKVEGSYKNSYHVQIYMDEKEILGSCTCPYDDACKHIIATVIQAKMAPDTSKENSISDPEVFLDYLNTLSKEKLVKLVDRFASKIYRTEVAMMGASDDDVEVHLKQIENAIQFTLHDDELLYSPSDFLDVALKHLECLGVHINYATEQVFEIVFDFVRDIEQKNDDGYLYCDDYYHGADEFFDFELFSEKIIDMINSVDDPQSQAEVLLDFAFLCEDSSYMYFSYNRIEIKQKSLLVDGIDLIKSISFYGYIKDLLTFEQKIAYLHLLPAREVALEIVALYEENDQKEKAVSYVETLLKDEFKIEYVNLLLRLTKVTQERLQAFVKQAIECHEFTAYAFIVKQIKKCDTIEELESHLKKIKPHWYYNYLETDKRVDEMHGMLKSLENNKLSFFQKYKHQYRDEAVDFFKAQINKELPFTGNDYYARIASYLKELQVIIDKEYFNTMVYELKTEFKRRRNFVKILNENFGE